MPTTRKKITRKPVRRISNRAVDLFDKMQTLESQCTCGPDSFDRCDACEQWWKLHGDLHSELHLMPWQWPVYANYTDTNKTGVFERYQALTAASNARK